MGRIRSDHDVAKMAAATMAAMGGYIVLAFCIGQFVAWFSWSNMGAIVAISGAKTLQGLGLEGAPLLVGLVFFAALLNLLITSASALWAIIAPIFVPMFMLLAYPPELTQVAYRIGDSSSNVISPMMSYFALIIAFFQRYEPKAGIGTLTATMLPYSLANVVAWSIMLVLWVAMGLPTGPGAPLFLR